MCEQARQRESWSEREGGRARERELGRESEREGVSRVDNTKISNEM